MGLSDKFKKNLGSSRPAMISRSGNMFTLRDAAGNERAPVHSLDMIIVDANANVSRMYREDKNYNGNDPTPPDCFSDNGEGPSSMATKPQSDRCQTCKWAVRGSATSKVDGKPITACSTNQKLAVLVQGEPSNTLFEFVVTPGNLTPFRNYVRTVEGHKYEVEEVVTRVTFVPKSMGILEFAPIGVIDDETRALAGSLAGTEAARFVTGETDTPIGALPAPAPMRQITAQPEAREEAPAPEPVKQEGPTREQLEAQLAALRSKDKPAKPKLVEASPAPVQAAAPQEVPAFLRARKDAPPNNAAFGMNGNAPPPPAEVSKLIDGAANQADARVDKAFSLPTR